jgi:hypothetical protein
MSLLLDIKFPTRFQAIPKPRASQPRVLHVEAKMRLVGNNNGSERRHKDRRRVYLGAGIVIGSEFSPVDCLVKNLSQTGAKLLAHDRIMPLCFALRFTKRASGTMLQLFGGAARRSAFPFVQTKRGHERAAGSLLNPRQSNRLRETQDKAQRNASR